MLYLLYGDDFKIKNEIDNIIKENNIEDINISKYELDAYNYKDIIEDAYSQSLFSEKKVIIVYDASIFTSEKSSVDTSLFEEYFEHINQDVIMIFTTNNKIDERKKIVKLIKKNGVVKEYENIVDGKVLVKDLLRDYNINNEALDTFISRVGNDYYSINNEIDKLKLYKGNDFNISLEDILNVTTNNVELDLFKLMDYIMDNNKKDAIDMYNTMLKYGTEPMQILIMLANKYRLLLQVKILLELGYKDSDIASQLKQNPKYIFVLNKLSRKYSKNSLIKQLKELGTLDYDIKSGKIDDKFGLELYILKK